MAISKPAFSSTPIQLAQLAVLDLVGSPPTLNVRLDPPEPPGRVIGYYNPTTDKVELYCASSGGTFWIQVG